MPPVQYPLSVEQPGIYSIPGIPFPVSAETAGGGGGSSPSNLVWQPGTVSAGNSYGPWADLQAAISALGEAHYSVTVDVSVAAAIVPAGANLGNGTWYGGAGGAPFVTVTFTGAITARRLELGGGLLSFVANAATPVWTPAAGAYSFLILNGDSFFQSVTAQPFVQVNAATALFYVQTTGSVFIGDGAHPVFNAGAGSNCILVLSDFTVVQAGALAGPGGASLAQISSGVAMPTPVVPAGWAFFAPAPNIAQAAAGAAGPAATVAITTGNIQQQYSGSVLVTATMCGVSSVAAVLTMTLQRDGAPLAGAPTAKTQVTVGEEFSLTLSWWDTLPDLAAHTYGASCTASAGTITQAAGVGAVVATEIRV